MPRRSEHVGILSEEERAAGVEAVQALRGALRSAAFYGAEHPSVRQWTDQAYEFLRKMLGGHPEVAWKLMDGEVAVGSIRLSDGLGNMKDLCDICEQRQVRSIIWFNSLRREDVARFIQLLLTPPEEVEGRGGPDRVLADLGVEGVQVAELVERTEEEGEGPEGAVDASRVYSQALNCVRSFMERVRRGERLEIERVTSVAAQIVDMVLRDPAAMLAMTALQSYDAYTFAHCVNVCVLTLALASKLGMPRSQLLALGVAGLVHDIGKVRVPLEILRKPGRMTDEDWAYMHRHPSAGAAILAAERRTPELAVVVALEHHMQYDLSGYPKPFRPRKLNACSLMVSLADCYDALTTFRPYRDPIPPHAALAVIEESAPNLYEPHLLRYFCQLMGVYPVGSGVLLSTGEQAVVVKPNPDDGRLPVVGIITTPAGARLPAPKFVDLARASDNVKIVESITEKELVADPAKVKEAFEQLSAKPQQR